MIIGKFILVHYQNSPVFLNVDHIIKVTELTNNKAHITLDDKEALYPDETFTKVIGAIENITCFCTPEIIPAHE